MIQEERYLAQDLLLFAKTLLIKSGLPSDKAFIVASTLLDADLLGHTTHGLALLSGYVKQLELGKMKSDGMHRIINDSGAAITWDGCYLPGPWLVHQAIDMALERIVLHPVVTIVIRRSHHIGCLATYPKRATDKGLVMLLSCSDPNVQSVAPFGGIQPVYSPNPIAAGFPTTDEPIILDISTSCTSNSFVNRTLEEGNQLPYPWLLDSNGHATTDPSVVNEIPPGTVLPLGGLDSGHKGFGLGILVEALTAALGGHGRADNPGQWGASVFLQLINPQGFAGVDAFRKEMDHLTKSCLQAGSRQPGSQVRMPGSRGFKLKTEQLSYGLRLHPGILQNLQKEAVKHGIKMPAPAGDG